jgi:hypothetical protein
VRPPFCWIESSPDSFVAVHPSNAVYFQPANEDLGIVFGDLGDYEGATAIDEKVYGPDHPLVATYLSNLGSVFQSLGGL